MSASSGLPKGWRRLSSRFTYFIATGLGLSFSLMLIFLAWHKAQEDEIKEFTFESIALREGVARRITASDELTYTVATQVEAMGKVRAESFQLFANAMLSRHPFIDSISYHPLVRKPPYRGSIATGFAESRTNPVASLDGEGLFQPSDLASYSLPLKFQAVRKSAQSLAVDFDLLSTPQFREVVRTAIETEVPLPTPPLSPEGKGGSYMLLKIVSALPMEGADPNLQPPDRIKGLVAVRIDPNYLFGHSPLRSTLSVTLFSESEGVSGRQVLFEKGTAATEAGGWVISSLREDIWVQFPYYSMKLAVEKKVHWGDLDQGLIILSALVLSAGISLLLFASTQAKEQEALELRGRNAEIERQVQQQTGELARARDQALEASRIKSEFLASMSHEIRTPLNAIIGVAELLAETPLRRDQQRYVEVFRKAGEALLNLVSDILDLSKIEARQLVLEAIDFDLRALVEEAVAIYALKTEEKAIELLCQIDPGVPSYVTGDPSRLRQILLNLIGNAIKFTDSGKVFVRVTRDPALPEPGSLVFSVADTGIGIPADKLDSIFESFAQVDSSTTRKYGGTGLGLTISNWLVELMGGRIWAESELGKGSTFSFKVRLGVAQEPAGQAMQPLTPERQGINKAPILLVEDTVDNRLLIKAHLKNTPYEVEEAGNGEVAVSKFKARSYSLVLMDVQMPVMDGYTATRAIRAWEREQGKLPTPIIALTAHAIKEDMERSKAAGCTAHLTKPIKKATLLQTIERYTG